MDFYENFVAAVEERLTAVMLASLMAVLYTAYYLTKVVKKPVIACGDAKLRKFIEKHCPVHKESYWPTWWGVGGRVQTIVRALLQTYTKADYQEELLKCPDGGLIKLDWVENDAGSRFPRATRPTVLMFPGLTGNSSENYILHLVKDTTQLGYRSVVFNNRGTCGTPLQTPRFYCASNVEDAIHVIAHIKQKYPEAPLIGVGISLGGMILFNYMAHQGSSAGLDAAMCVSVNWNVSKGLESLESPINYHLFNRMLAKSLCCIIQKHKDVFKDHKDLDFPHILKSESIKDFDERFTSKMFGYESVYHYYEHATLHTKVHALGRPVLCLSSGDDPFSPEHSIPLKDANENDNIAIVKTARGGHIGFTEGLLPLGGTYMNRWYRQFARAVFEHGIKED